MDMTKTRPADILAIFAPALGSPATPQCAGCTGFDPSKLNCGRAEMETIVPRPLCTAPRSRSLRMLSSATTARGSLCTVCFDPPQPQALANRRSFHASRRWTTP